MYRVGQVGNEADRMTELSHLIRRVLLRRYARSNHPPLFVVNVRLQRSSPRVARRLPVNLNYSFQLRSRSDLLAAFPYQSAEKMQSVMIGKRTLAEDI